jgi:hypothetical protein
MRLAVQPPGHVNTGNQNLRSSLHPYTTQHPTWILTRQRRYLTVNRANGLTM